MITLRSYQTEGIAKIRAAFASGFKAPIYVSPTGSGKTTVFAAVAQSSERRGKRVLILCHRVELVDQIVDRLKKFDVIPDIIASGYGRSAGRFRASNHSIGVASVQTLVHRLGSYPPPTLIVIDECHHVTLGGQWSAILRHYSDAKNLGFTATPIRLDGRGLASHFDTMIVGPSVAELTAMGYLAPARIFAPPTVDTSGLHIRGGEFRSEETESLMDTPSITGDALAHYRKHANNLQALVFCTSVAHAHHVAERFRNDNIPAMALDGGTDKQIRRAAVQDFRDGKIKVMASCQIFSEGFDLENVHVGILLRPTASEGLWRQQIGRVLRPAPNKTHAIILDHVNSCQNFGLPDEHREWTLTSDIVHKSKKKPGVRVCPKCFAASPARARTCAECGHIFEVSPRQEVAEKDGELHELTPEDIARRQTRRAKGMTKELQDLIAFGKKKGYADGWAVHVYEAREAKKRKKELERERQLSL